MLLKLSRSALAVPDPSEPVRPCPDLSEPLRTCPDLSEPLRTSPDLSPVRVGLLGLGQVGQAVARLASHAGRDGLGRRFRIESALVRHVDRPRRCARPPRVTSNPSAFLRGQYDLVVEALGAVEPARTLVARLLGRGVPVVSANKALVAAHGPELDRIAARAGTSFRYEASALAGVPFIGALAARPLLSQVERFAAVVNGTSNFILSSLEANGGTVEDALGRAERLGLSEPDPSRDLDGEDAADKLCLLASLVGWGRLLRPALEVRGIRAVTAADMHAARSLGGALRPLVWANTQKWSDPASPRSGVRPLARNGLQAFVGPVFLPASHPLASVSGTLSGIQLHGRYLQDLFFSGPGAGPDITAATLLDDGVEALGAVKRFPLGSRPCTPASVSPPATPWFLRLRFPGLVPGTADVQALLGSCGLAPERVAGTVGTHPDTRWVLAAISPREQVDTATTRLRHEHRVEAVAFRRIQ